MPSTYSMIERAGEIEYLLLENEVAEEKMDDEERILLETELSDLYFEVEKKVDNIDNFTLDLDAHKASIQARLTVINNEAKRLRKRREGLEKTHKYFYGQIIPKVINQFGDGKQYKTDSATYEFREKFSKLITEDLAQVDEKFLKFPAPVIDGTKARSAAIAAHKAGTKLEGCYVYKEKFVKKI